MSGVELLETVLEFKVEFECFQFPVHFPVFSTIFLLLVTVTVVLINPVPMYMFTRGMVISHGGVSFCSPPGALPSMLSAVTYS